MIGCRASMPASRGKNRILLLLPLVGFVEGRRVSGLTGAFRAAEASSSDCSQQQAVLECHDPEPNLCSSAQAGALPLGVSSSPPSGSGTAAARSDDPAEVLQQAEAVESASRVNRQAEPSREEPPVALGGQGSTQQQLLQLQLQHASYLYDVSLCVCQRICNAIRAQADAERPNTFCTQDSDSDGAGSGDTGRWFFSVQGLGSASCGPATNPLASSSAAAADGAGPAAAAATAAAATAAPAPPTAAATDPQGGSAQPQEGMPAPAAGGSSPVISSPGADGGGLASAASAAVVPAVKKKGKPPKPKPKKKSKAAQRPARGRRLLLLPRD